MNYHLDSLRFHSKMVRLEVMKFFRAIYAYLQFPFQTGSIRRRHHQAKEREIEVSIPNWFD